jgi:glycosyltransferase involved in cell wall biosynthesis
MRIARVIARLNVGGPARHVAWLTAAIEDSILVTGRVAPGEDDMSGFARALGVEPIVLGEMSRALSWRDAVVVWRLFRIFRRFRPDVIHTHTAKAGTVGRVAGLLYRLTTRRRVRFVHTFHGHVFHGYYGRLATAIFLTIERALARVTDAIVVLSPRQRDEIHGRYRVGRAAQFIIVPLGLDLAPYAKPIADPRAALELPRDAFVVAIVGRLTEVKDHEFFLRAFAAWGDERAMAIIVGDGHLRGALERLARDLGIEHRVRFLGTRHDPEVFYRAADLVVLTSRNEGTPLTILEAMVAGVPVLATAVGGVPDLLGDDRGVMIPHGDTAAFVDAISRLAGDAQRRARLAATGRAFVQENYGRERLVQDIRNLYQSLVRG